MMKAALFTLLLPAIFLTSLSAQDKVNFGQAIGAKVLFTDHGQPNSIDTLDLTNGLELVYIKGINKFLNFALPIKVSTAKVAGDINNRNIVSLDGVLQFQLYKPAARIIPYAMLGGGMVFEQTNGSYWQVPVGAGFNLRVGANSFVNVQAEYRYANEENRKNLQLGLGYVYRFVKVDRDRDRDGVLNAEDGCPDTFGPKETMGCPDGDNDGLADHQDVCPDAAGPKETQGCPDTDEDGLTDNQDDCPQVAGLVELNGCPDTDGDGVADNKDSCPETEGPASNNGCPIEATVPETESNRDSDGDGVADKDDVCPKLFGLASNNGCPEEATYDTDGDGIMDEEDDCPNEFGLKATNGCPDGDGDGVADRYDLCPHEVGLPLYKGCPDKRDTDNDGVTDDIDDCPTEFGLPNTRGCPDADGDGVPDKDDRCPNVAGADQGCPDTDGDGIMDADDRCPNTFGLRTNSGCPEIDARVREILEFAMQAVQFETGKATLKAVSYNVLDQIAGIMGQYPAYKLSISGHTDNVGGTLSNQILSEERAQSCYEFLIAAGVEASRISHTGYGEKQPIASNNTEEGRSLNRRVEFDLYVD